MDEYRLCNSKGQTLAMGSLDQMMRAVKHHEEDGIYTIEGPDTDLIVERANGVVYPTGGCLKGEKLPPRTLHEAKNFFGK